eukprot:4030905-Amphidinium_carterae.1
MTPTGTHQIQGMLFYTVKTVLPSAEYSRIGIGRGIMRPPRNGPPRRLPIAINWLEDFFNRYTVVVSVNVFMEPKEILAFVMGNVKLATANDLELSLTLIDLKKIYDVTWKMFSHQKLESLLRELIVQIKLRRTSVRVDKALGISTQQQLSARNAEAEANGAMAPPKKKPSTPPKRKV